MKKSNIQVSNFNFLNSIGENTDCDIYRASITNTTSNNSTMSYYQKRPFILLIHGFRAYKMWGFFPYFAERLAKAGYIAGIIDFSLNKLIDKEKCLFDMERFKKNTVTQEIAETKELLYLLQTERPTELEDWNGEVYLIGHSLGGAIAIMTANNTQCVKKLVTICSIPDFDIYTHRQKEKWKEQGIKEFRDAKTGQLIQLEVNFLIDRLTYCGERSILATVSKLTIPYLALHTEADVTISPIAAETLINATSDKSLAKLEIIQHGNHLLNCEHPFIATNPILENVIDSAIKFLKM